MNKKISNKYIKVINQIENVKKKIIKIGWIYLG